MSSYTVSMNETQLHDGLVNKSHTSYPAVSLSLVVNTRLTFHAAQNVSCLMSMFTAVESVSVVILSGNFNC